MDRVYLGQGRGASFPLLMPELFQRQYIMGKSKYSSSSVLVFLGAGCDEDGAGGEEKLQNNLVVQGNPPCLGSCFY